MDRKKFESKKYLLVFVFTLILFIAGIALGLYFGTFKVNQIQQLQDSFKADSLDIDIQYSLLDQDPCDFLNTSTLTQKLQDIGEKLDYMGTTLGENDTSVVQLKSYYSLLEISHWLFRQDVSKRCSDQNHWILYFYSNTKSQCPQCEDQGFILSYLKKKYGDNLAIYSFDTSLSVDSLTMIEKLYHVDTYPTIIVDNKTLSGFQTLDQIESSLAQQNQSSLLRMNNTNQTNGSAAQNAQNMADTAQNKAIIVTERDGANTTPGNNNQYN